MSNFNKDAELKTLTDLEQSKLLLLERALLILTEEVFLLNTINSLFPGKVIPNESITSPNERLDKVHC